MCACVRVIKLSQLRPPNQPGGQPSRKKGLTNFQLFCFFFFFVIKSLLAPKRNQPVIKDKSNVSFAYTYTCVIAAVIGHGTVNRIQFESPIKTSRIYDADHAATRINGLDLPGRRGWGGGDGGKGGEGEGERRNGRRRYLAPLTLTRNVVPLHAVQTIESIFCADNSTQLLADPHPANRSRRTSWPQ